VITVKNGKIQELHQYFDMLTILQQIGAVPQ
jgi:ketosteroid isomerase-like protein